MNHVKTGLYAHVLVLNRNYTPLSIVPAKRAFQLLIKDIAKALDADMQLFDFSSWMALSVSLQDDVIKTPSRDLRVPRVVILQVYDKLPNRALRFNRQNIYMRDRFICQYCGKQFPRDKLNLDHVVPRTLGGETTWENVVCCCIPCNLKKGGRTPYQANMRLLNEPVRPKPYGRIGNLECEELKPVPYREWLPFLDVISASYWNAELEP